MTPIEISNVLLFVLGVLLQLVFLYIPEAKTWYQRQSHQGLLMLGMVVLLGVAIFGLSCTPLVVYLHIAIACTVGDAFNLLGAIVIIATGNQLTYLFAPQSKG